MQDFNAKIAELLSQAEDCERIAALATTRQKRELFTKLSADLRSMVEEIKKRT